MTPIGERNERIALKFIRDYVTERGFPPSVREVQVVLGHASTSTTHAVLRGLVSHGLVTVHLVPSGLQYIPRSLKITEAGMQMIAADVEAM